MSVSGELRHSGRRNRLLFALRGILQGNQQARKTGAGRAWRKIWATTSSSLAIYWMCVSNYVSWSACVEARSIDLYVRVLLYFYLYYNVQNSVVEIAWLVLGRKFTLRPRWILTKKTSARFWLAYAYTPCPLRDDSSFHVTWGKKGAIRYLQ